MYIIYLLINFELAFLLFQKFIFKQIFNKEEETWTE